MNKRLLLGVSGGIAAYKSAELIRRLQDQGAEVRVVMTEGSQQFITPLTLQALSGNPVSTDLLDPAAEAAMGHIELARWADLVLVAPATANVMARLAYGHADDLLTTLCLATNAPICLAPAMNQAMWRHSATQANRDRLINQGITLFGPGSGSQACGDIGPGRMLEVDDLVERACEMFQPQRLAGKQVVITAGPTREALDPVRYISNHSSGKMGYALAAAASELGANVTLISGPVGLRTPDRASRVDISSANEMYQAVHENISGCDLFIACAAVADYRPASVSEHKLKKDTAQDHDEIQLTLVRNPDIVASVAALEDKPFVVGFAAETRDVIGYAEDKLRRKRLDMIIANNVSVDGIGFNSDENAVTVLADNFKESLGQVAKSVLARQLIGVIADRMGLKAHE